MAFPKIPGHIGELRSHLKLAITQVVVYKSSVFLGVVNPESPFGQEGLAFLWASQGWEVAQ